MLHRAIANAGDFLIRDRTIRLLETHRPDLSLRLGRGWRPLVEEFTARDLGTAKALVISGGPGYTRGMYPRLYPLDRLDRIPAPVFLMALGSFRFLGLRDQGVDTSAVDFLQWVLANGGALGARDDMTIRMLARAGIHSVTMTGDPAWYDTDWLDRDAFGSDQTTVAFTAPANPLFQAQGLRLFNGVVRKFGPARVTLVSHRETQPAFEDAARRLGVSTRDISGGSVGFALFDTVGLHIGYRVHAHLYCLSHETPTCLVAEDSRGLGMLETLGPLGIDALEPHHRALLGELWRVLPRVGSARSPVTRWLGTAASRAVAAPDVTDEVLARISSERDQGYRLHRAAKETIRSTYPAMVQMVASLP